MSSYRSTASFGKRQEYRVISKLLSEGFDVYQTLVDDQGIDCVIRREKNNELKYLDIQIKARSKDCKKKNAGRFAAMDISPRENYFFIFYSEQADMYWLVPSKRLVELARQNKTGKNQGKYTIDFCQYIRKDSKVMPNPKYDDYKYNINVLK